MGEVKLKVSEKSCGV